MPVNPANRGKGPGCTSAVTSVMKNVPPELRCTAIAKRTGERCRGIRTRGFSMCRFHRYKRGGHGQTIPTIRKIDFFVSKRFAPLLKLPKGLAEAFKEAREDPELLSLKNGVALVEVRICQLIDNMNAGASAEIWDELKTCIGQIRDARFADDRERIENAIATVETIVERGASQKDQWAELFDALTMKKDMASAEWKRLVDLRQVMTAEKVFVMMAVVVDIISRNVADTHAKQVIATEITNLMGGYGVVPTQASGYKIKPPPKTTED